MILLNVETTVAKEAKLSEGDTAKFSGVLIEEKPYRDLIFKERMYDDLDKRFEELQKIAPYNEEPCEDGTFDEIIENVLIFVAGGATAIVILGVGK